MPIANCMVADPATVDADAVVEAWSERAGIAADEMTLNLVAAVQGGKRYAAMAWLHVPSLWSDGEVVALGEGLAAALAGALDVEPSAVQVVTSVVSPGLVVDDGRTIHW